MNSELYFGGLPTGPEVKKLEAAFPNISELRGTTLSHESVELALTLSRDSARYKTVVNVWRKKVERDAGISIRGDLKEVIGIGFRVLSDSEQLQYGGDLRVRGGRRIRKSHIVIANTNDDKLTPEERKIKEHGILAGRHIHAAIMESRKFLVATTQPERPVERKAPEQR